MINYKVVESSLSEDPIYKIYSKLKKNDNKPKKSERVAMALCSAFFFNSARRVHNANEDYMLLAEGNLLNLDPLSAFSVTDNYPEYIIFTELAGK